MNICTSIECNYILSTIEQFFGRFPLNWSLSIVLLSFICKSDETPQNFVDKFSQFDGHFCGASFFFHSVLNNWHPCASLIFNILAEKKLPQKKNKSQKGHFVYIDDIYIRNDIVIHRINWGEGEERWGELNGNWLKDQICCKRILSRLDICCNFPYFCNKWQDIVQFGPS